MTADTIEATGEQFVHPCTKAQAVYALCQAAFYQEDEDRCLTHSFLGPFGADWDVAGAIALITAADSVQWNDYGIAGHELMVRVHDEQDRKTRQYFFDVKRPR